MYFHTNRYGRRGAAIHAISGVDIALWDLRGKALGKPVYELWAARHPAPIRAYASYLFGDTPDETARLAREAIDLGLRAVKFGWGPFGNDPQTDRRHVAAARRAVGDECELMVDVGCKWDARTALERARLLAPFRLGWLEEPLSQDDLRTTPSCAASRPCRSRPARGR
jgi:L-alanine-DL-glutamate epimerase-like enolase superfamily enzyme